MHNVDHFGFPHGKAKQGGRSYGFRTGDMVRAVITSGKKVGTYTGRVLVRATGSFDIATRNGRIAGISYKYCQAIHRTEGYSYSERFRLDEVGSGPLCATPQIRNAHSSPS